MEKMNKRNRLKTKEVFLEKAQICVGEFSYNTQMLENFEHLTFFSIAI